jgi:hypothetical protein
MPAGPSWHRQISTVCHSRVGSRAPHTVMTAADAGQAGRGAVSFSLRHRLSPAEPPGQTGDLSGHDAPAVQGRSNAAIAQRLVISERAVAKHAASIFLRLDLQPSDDDNRRVLAVLAHLGR